MKNIVQSALQDRLKDDKEKREKNLKERIAKDKLDEKKMKESIKNIEQKARSRPLLIESSFGGKQATNLAKIKAT